MSAESPYIYNMYMLELEQICVKHHHQNCMLRIVNVGDPNSYKVTNIEYTYASLQGK
jgi:hypothetical protein